MGNLGLCWRHGDRDIFLSLWYVSGCFDWCFRCGVVVSQRERASFKSGLGSIRWDPVRNGIEVRYLGRNGLLFYPGFGLDIYVKEKLNLGQNAKSFDGGVKVMKKRVGFFFVWMIIFVMYLMSSWVAAEAHAKPQSMIWTKADFTVPAGWSEYEEMILGEPVLTLSRGLYTIEVHLFGGPDSRHETPTHFLSSWEARDEKGKPAKELGQVLVGDRMAPLYVRTFSMSGRDRDRPDRMGLERSYREEFIIVPAGKSFFVLTFTVPIEPPPIPDKSVETAWKAFLKSFILK